MKLLSSEEYQTTLVPNMVNVTENADEIINLWCYVDPIIESEYHNFSAWNWRVNHIYETPDGKFQHIGIAVPLDDTYLIVIVDKLNRKILGHYILNLNELYLVEGDNGT